MENFEGAIREMSQRGDASACVPAALKDAGLPVPQSMFIEATFKGGMDLIRAAEALGYSTVEVEGLDLMSLPKKLKIMKSQGLYPFVRLGIPTEMGVLATHVNSVNDATEVNEQPGLSLGGIPPFGKDKGNNFSMYDLKKVVPPDGIVVLKKQ
jgi:hypothetical protein